MDDALVSRSTFRRLSIVIQSSHESSSVLMRSSFFIDSSSVSMDSLDVDARLFLGAAAVAFDVSDTRALLDFCLLPDLFYAKERIPER